MSNVRCESATRKQKSQLADQESRICLMKQRGKKGVGKVMTRASPVEWNNEQ